MGRKSDFTPKGSPEKKEENHKGIGRMSGTSLLMIQKPRKERRVEKGKRKVRER